MTKRSTRQTRRSAQRGFTYLGLLLAVAIVSLGLTLASELWVKVAQRQRKEQLTWVGQQFVVAIGSYYHAAPGGIKRYPPQLDDLLLDQRFTTVRRHLRKLYLNPYTGKPDWAALTSPDGGVQGVRALDEPGLIFVFTPASP